MSLARQQRVWRWDLLRSTRRRSVAEFGSSRLHWRMSERCATHRQLERKIRKELALRFFAAGLAGIARQSDLLFIKVAHVFQGINLGYRLIRAKPQDPRKSQRESAFVAR